MKAQLRGNSCPEEGDIMKLEGEIPNEIAWKRNKGNSALTHQAFEPGESIVKGDTMLDMLRK